MNKVSLEHLVPKKQVLKDLRVMSKEHRSQSEVVPIGQIWDSLSISEDKIVLDCNTLKIQDMTGWCGSVD